MILASYTDWVKALIENAAATSDSPEKKESGDRMLGAESVLVALGSVQLARTLVAWKSVAHFGLADPRARKVFLDVINVVRTDVAPVSGDFDRTAVASVLLPAEARQPATTYNGGVRVAVAAQRLGITAKEVLQRVDAGTLRAIKTPEGHLEIVIDEGENLG